MQIVPVDIVGLVAVFMGISIVLVPVIGLTARFALKPTVEALGRFFEQKGLDETVHILERRMALMEQQLESMDESMERLTEIVEFHRALNEGEDADTAGGLAPGDETEPAATAPEEGSPAPASGEERPS